MCMCLFIVAHIIEIVSHTHVRLSKKVLFVGVVIEGRYNAELPEQMLPSTLLNRIDP
jgi:hypothetical protein